MVSGFQIIKEDPRFCNSGELEHLQKLDANQISLLWEQFRGEQQAKYPAGGTNEDPLLDFLIQQFTTTAKLNSEATFDYF